MPKRKGRTITVQTWREDIPARTITVNESSRKALKKLTDWQERAVKQRQLNVRVDEAVNRELKVLAAEKDTTVQALVELAIRQLLRRSKRRIPNND